jgi:hypothetical protein
VFRRRCLPAWLLALALSAGLDGALPARALAQTPVAVSVSASSASRPLASGFLGFSFEYQALRAYAGRDPDHLNPVLLSLVRQLNPGQSPLLRIGGNSTDQTWWPTPGVIPPAPVDYPLSDDWLRVAHALAVDLNAKLILGVNLEADRPALAAQEGRALLAGIGRARIAALEIGNEPDLYGRAVWARTGSGRAIHGRPEGYDFAEYLQQFTRWRQALRPLPLAGPALATTSWMNDLPQLLSADPLSYATFHIYPLRACKVPAGSPLHPSIANLLADRSTSGIAQTVAPYVTYAHAAGVPFRLDELNSASCKGAPGVSNTFASSLWVLDTLFNLASVGVDGINLHTLPGAPYQPFTFSDRGGVWRGTVMPVYYGMLMFARAFPPGAHLLATTAPSGALKVWATLGSDQTLRTVLINQSLTQTEQVAITLPPAGPSLLGTPPPPPLSVETLAAPSPSATGGISIAGQSFPAGTRTGALSGTLQAPQLDAVDGTYYITLQPASAVMLTR